MTKGDVETLKSLVSNELSFVRFHNSTQRTVNVIWINFSGHPIKYNTLQPNQYVDINTYVNHLWIIQDERTGDRLLANQQYVFYPESWEKLQSRILRGRYIDRMARLIVNIQIPLYTLRDCAMMVVRDCITSWDDVKQLELPNTISEELCNMVAKKQTYQNSDAVVM